MTGRGAATGLLDVGGGHRLRWWRDGNPGGAPLVLVHGGPGGRSSPRHLALVDPARWHVVRYDQRGCGASAPRGRCAHNTTDDLVADLERLRAHLGVDTWTVLGFSWGAAVALLWAARHGGAADAVLLGAPYLGRHEDPAVGRWHPDLDPATWRRFTESLDERERDDPARAHLRRALDPAHPDHLGAVRRWVAFDAACAGLPYAPERVTPEPGMAESVAVEAHYVAHDFFLPPHGVLPSLGTVPRHVPVHVVQGAGDPTGLRCTAALAAALPHAEVTVVDAGHSVLHPGVRTRLRAAASAVAGARREGHVVKGTS
ncbi:alpha/beta fold hydrolase [Saccharothrix sp. Mg75]|uniref:alpha/beta fold hydrolase n=1 Tax=Saccharothrix sp. Mg75 TaxID=3445357 RepID=UPI003EED6382